jgi:hypothetical protein
MNDCLIDVAAIEKCVGEIPLGRPAIRINLDRALKCRNRFVDLARRDQGDSETADRLAIARLRRQVKAIAVWRCVSPSSIFPSLSSSTPRL